MESGVQSRPSAERRKPNRIPSNKDRRWTIFMVVITLAMAIGFLVSTQKLYKPGDAIGYNLGLAGGLMMLTLLMYPLRKRIKFMRSWGLLPKWFKLHMVFGILGPALIMFHSTFTIKSINAGVALVCMMLVSGSGIAGRFFYTKIHFGLYGRQSSFEQLHALLEGEKNVVSIFSFAPTIHHSLLAFKERVLKAGKGRKMLPPWKLAAISFESRRLSRVLTHDLRTAMYQSSSEGTWSASQSERIDELFQENKEFIRSYVSTLRDMAQFGTYERLFSLWHVLHVPLVYMLAFSAIWHVIAVHMY
jgi:hypothetical protein